MLPCQPFFFVLEADSVIRCLLEAADQTAIDQYVKRGISFSAGDD
jgi:hypothetical protein